MKTSTTDLKKALRSTRVRPLQALIEKATADLAGVLPPHMTADRLTFNAMMLLRRSPNLSRCSHQSFLGALLTGAQLHLEPVAGRFFVTAELERRRQGGRWVTVYRARFVMGYQGLVDLFYRHAKALKLEWGVVRAGDEFEHEKGTQSFIRHRPNMAVQGEPYAYYVVATLDGAEKVFEVISRERCIAHGRRHSRSFDEKTGAFYPDSPWATDSDSMCLKTTLVQLSKLLPLALDLQKAIRADETTREWVEGTPDVLAIPDGTNWNPPGSVSQANLGPTVKDSEGKGR